MAKQKAILQPGTGQITIDLGEANPKQELFYQSRTLFTAYGGARGGGKTHAIRVKAVGGAVRWPGIKILILRRTYPELQSNHIDPVLKIVPREVAAYNAALHTLYFVNESIIKFGHYQAATGEQEYQGQEFDWIFLDEATQFTEREFRFLGGLLRGVNRIPKRFYITCNPGGVGHRWVKRLFIDKAFHTNSTNAEENENSGDYTFIFATVEDNTHLMKSSPAYVKMLSSLPENIRKAHRYGDWDALGGTYFPEFSLDKHVIKPFRIPECWARYRAFDYGLDMLACLWFAVDTQGRSYLYRELKAKNRIVSEAAKLMLEHTAPNERISVTFAPPDMWSRQKDTGKTMAELFMTGNVPIIAANNSRVQGWLQLKEMLSDMPDGRPGLLLFNSCTEFIGDMQAMLSDENNPNDCAKEPHEITHILDASRYYAISRTLPSEKSEPLSAMEEDGKELYDDFMTGGFSLDYLNF